MKHLWELEKQDTFFSPGKLYEGLTVEDLKTDQYQSHLCNYY